MRNRMPNTTPFSYRMIIFTMSPDSSWKVALSHTDPPGIEMISQFRQSVKKYRRCGSGVGRLGRLPDTSGYRSFQATAPAALSSNAAPRRTTIVDGPCVTGSGVVTSFKGSSGACDISGAGAGAGSSVSGTGSADSGVSLVPASGVDDVLSPVAAARRRRSLVAITTPLPEVSYT